MKVSGDAGSPWQDYRVQEDTDNYIDSKVVWAAWFCFFSVQAGFFTRFFSQSYPFKQVESTHCVRPKWPHTLAMLESAPLQMQNPGPWWSLARQTLSAMVCLLWDLFGVGDVCESAAESSEQGLATSWQGAAAAPQSPGTSSSPVLIGCSLNLHPAFSDIHHVGNRCTHTQARTRTTKEGRS